jgi:PAS domain S-box-containing protein
LFGYIAEEMIGKPVALLIPPGRENEEADMLSRIRRGEMIGHYETVRQRKDGSLIDISLTVSPLRDAGNRIVGACKIARDVTDRRRAEQIAQRLVAIVESSDNAIVAKYLDGIITSWNRGCRVAVNDENCATFMVVLHPT